MRRRGSGCGGAPTLTVDPMSVSALWAPCAVLGLSTLAVAVGMGGDFVGGGRKEEEEGGKGREVEAYEGFGDRGVGLGLRPASSLWFVRA